jgi:hypothetical protein
MGFTNGVLATGIRAGCFGATGWEKQVPWLIRYRVGSHVSGLLLLLFILGPDQTGMSPESKPEADDVGQEKKEGSEPCIGLDGFLKKRVLDRCGLRKVALAAVSTLRAELSGACMTIQLMLRQGEVSL